MNWKKPVKLRRKNGNVTYETRRKRSTAKIKQETIRERGQFCNNFLWDEADANVRSYIFSCLGVESQMQLQQKYPGHEINNNLLKSFSRY